MNTQEQFIRLATKREIASETAKRAAIVSFPEHEGYRVGYKPYGEQGRGFYYVPRTLTAQEKFDSVPTNIATTIL